MVTDAGDLSPGVESADDVLFRNLNLDGERVGVLEDGLGAVSAADSHRFSAGDDGEVTAGGLVPTVADSDLFSGEHDSEETGLDSDLRTGEADCAETGLSPLATDFAILGGEVNIAVAGLWLCTLSSEAGPPPLVRDSAFRNGDTSSSSIFFDALTGDADAGSADPSRRWPLPVCFFGVVLVFCVVTMRRRCPAG